MPLIIPQPPSPLQKLPQIMQLKSMQLLSIARHIMSGVLLIIVIMSKRVPLTLIRLENCTQFQDSDVPPIKGPLSGGPFIKKENYEKH